MRRRTPEQRDQFSLAPGNPGGFEFLCASRGRSGRLLGAQSLGLLHGSHEPVAITPAGLDEGLRAPGVSDGLADVLDAAFDRRVADELARPYTCAKVVLRQQVLTMLEQIQKHLECLWSERNRQTASVQGTELCVEKTVGEQVACRGPTIANSRVSHG